MPTDWKTERARRFPADLLKAAQAAERTTGVPTCLTLAQWAWESAWGSRCAGSYNYFGMKWKPSCGYPKHAVLTHEVINGKRIEVTADFIAFPSLEAACDYHGKLLANPRGPYAAAQPYLRKDWRKFVETICPIYATDPEYKKAILNVIDTYHLQDFNLPANA